MSENIFFIIFFIFSSLIVWAWLDIFRFLRKERKEPSLPKELAKNHVVVVRRDNFEKKNVKIKDLNKFIEKSLVKMHKDMLLKAKKKLDDNIVTVSNINELTNAINNRKVARARFCCNSSCENLLKGKIQGVRTVNISFDQPKVSGKCFLCSKDAINEVLFGKNY